jgi:hypothetical protein
MKIAVFVVALLAILALQGWFGALVWNFVAARAFDNPFLLTWWQALLGILAIQMIFGVGRRND